MGNPLGLAVPVNGTTRRIVAELMSDGRVRRAWLGDVVITAGDRPVTTAQDLQRLMIATEIGRALPITVYRKGALVDVVAELAELPAR